MATFSKRSKINLSQCHEDLQVLFTEVIKEYDCAVICGHRGEEEQNNAFAKGFSKLKYPKSNHNKIPSLAADVVPYPIDWANKKRFKELGDKVKQIAGRLLEEGKITHRIDWGGDWKKFVDLPHYEIKLK